MEINQIKVKKLKPERVATPQCCVPVNDGTTYKTRKSWRLKHYGEKRPHFDPLLCQLESTHNIDGKHYCRSHAAKLLLDMYDSGKITIHQTDGQEDQKLTYEEWLEATKLSHEEIPF